MKILFISLGCDKNLADSEEMLGLLTGSGHEIVDSEEEAEAIVINTCCSFMMPRRRVSTRSLKWQNTRRPVNVRHWS